MRKGFESLYTELVMALIVTSIGAAILPLMRTVGSLDVEVPEADSSLYALVVRDSGDIVIINDGDAGHVIHVICTDGDVVSEEVGPGYGVVIEEPCTSYTIVDEDGDAVPVTIVG